MGSRNNNKKIGCIGERAAVEYLRKLNQTILETNFRYKRMGEIDIITMEKEFVCFIEVKTRSSSIYGTPSEAVNRTKQNNIKKLAQIFVSMNKIDNAYLRFDVIEIILSRTSSGLKLKNVNYIKNAF